MNHILERAPGGGCHARRRFPHAAGWAIAIPAALLLAAQAPATLSPERVLVLYNARAPGSKEVAEHYCRGRGVAPERLLALQCPAVEQVTRQEFEAAIRNPVDSFLRSRGLIERAPQEVRHGGQALQIEVPTHNEVHSLVLCWGVPLRIADDTNRVDSSAQPQFRTTAAAVDSELALLPVSGIRLSGPVPNPFFRASQSFDGRAARSIMLVARLDGPSPETVRRRLDEAWQVERDGLVGRACFDLRGIQDKGYKEGDDWLKRAAQAAERWGLPTATEQTDAIAGIDALWSDVALYAGWYAASLSGALAAPEFRFRPGAVAYHIHSYSAQTLRSATAGWVGPLVARGAAAAMGSVTEPYLALTPHIDIFVENLLAGWTFAEAAYACQPVLSWMNTVVGDPLYRPFPQFPESWLRERLARPDGPDPWLFFIDANRRKNAANVASVFADVEGFLSRTRDPVAWELGGEFFAATFDPDRAVAACLKGAAFAPPGPVAVRMELKAVRLLADRGRYGQVWDALDRLGRTTGNAPVVRATAEIFNRRPEAQPVSEYWRAALLPGAQGPTPPIGGASPGSSATPPVAPPANLVPAAPAPGTNRPVLPTPHFETPKMQFPKLERPQIRPQVFEPRPAPERP